MLRMKLPTTYGASWVPADEGRERWNQNITQKSVLWIARHDLSLCFQTPAREMLKNSVTNQFDANKNTFEDHAPNTMQNV